MSATTSALPAMMNERGVLPSSSPFGLFSQATTRLRLPPKIRSAATTVRWMGARRGWSGALAGLLNTAL